MAVVSTGDATPRMDEIETGSTLELEDRAEMPAVTQGFDQKKIIIGLISGFVILFLLFSIFTGGSSQSAVEEEPTVDSAASVDPQGIVSAYGADLPPVEGQEVPEIDGTQPTSYSDSRGRGDGPRYVERGGPPPKSERQTLAEASRRSGLIAVGGSGQQPGAGTAQSGDVDPRAGRGAPPSADDGGSQTALDGLRQASQLGVSPATRLPDRNYLITAGTFIPCTLLSAMNSSQPGYTTCVVPRDVYSDNGRVVLMEKGTRLLGEYQGGIRRGQYRLFVLWTRATTPTGVAIALGSPASDALGRAGVAGGVDTFFWERFGAAFLFSLVEDASQIGRDQLSNNQGQNITEVPSDSSATILRDTQNIQPVLKKNQGDNIGVLAAQDFDFSSVYRLRIK